MAKFPSIAAAILCLTLADCASTPTVDESKALQAKWEADCRAKGYKSNTPDFQTCINHAAAAAANPYNNPTAQAGMGMMAGSILLQTIGAFSDIRLKRDVEKVGELQEGMGLYRFRYLWSDEVHIGVIAQEVEMVRPDAVEDHGGYLWVNYSRLRR